MESADMRDLGSRAARRWGSSPHTRTTSSRTSYRSRRRFLFQSKRHLSFTPSLLLSAKGHARLACSLVNALTTARCRYQPFAGFIVCRYHPAHQKSRPVRDGFFERWTNTFEAHRIICLIERITHFISCSRASNSGDEKNSASVMSKPSQIFFIVRIFGSVLLP